MHINPLRWLKKRPGRAGAAVEHHGFTIVPDPQRVTGGWSTAAVIRWAGEGEARQHTFIRADTSPTREAAIALIVAKARRLIDERGEALFS